MLICKFSKTDSAVYMPHLDLIRAVGMTLRRASLPVRFSEGFNPHALLYFSQPLPLGTHSTAEYFGAEIDCNAHEFVARFNSNAPNGVTVRLCRPVDQSINLYSASASARYQVSFEGVLESELRQICARLIATDSVPITYISKGEKVTKDVRKKILNLTVVDTTITADLSSGNDNLRADRLATAIAEMVGGQVARIERIAQFDSRGNDLDTVFGLHEIATL